MPEFRDDEGTTWTVALDGLLLGELREKGIDIVQDGLYFIEEREDVLTKALLVLCREQKEGLKLSDRQFAGRIRSEVQDRAIAAVRGAAELFFRPSKWSEIQSRYTTRRDNDQVYRDMLPLTDLLNRPNMPREFREAVMAQIRKAAQSAMGGEPSTSDESTASESASGQDANQSNAAGESPGLSVAVTSAA